MRKIATAAVAALVANTMLTVPAFAAVGLPSDAEAKCLAAVPPPGTIEEDDEPGTPWLIQPVSIDVSGPTAEATGNISKFNFVGIEDTLVPIGGDAANVTSPSQLHRNGSSPNLHGWGLSASSMYLDSSYDYKLEYVDAYSFTFGCKVYKVRQHGAKAGTEIVPNGLQIPRTTPNAAPPLSSTEYSDPYYGETQHAASGGGSLPNGTQVPVEMVVCISPNGTTKGKPGTWKVQNNAGVSPEQCATRSNELGGATLVNQNAPTS